MILAAVGLFSSGAFGQDAVGIQGGAEPPVELKTLVQSCAAHKFETIVTTFNTEGRPHGSRVKICGMEGQSNADWLVTLKDSITKTETNADLEQPVRDQIVEALKAEIARLEQAPAATVAVAPATTIDLPRELVAVPDEAPQYSIVPPLPAPLPRRAASGASAASAPIARPRLSISCALPHESFASCGRLERETRVMIRADEDLAAGTTVRFLRGGDTRAELDLGQLKKGGSLRESLPARVCSGVLRGKVQVQILSKGRVADTLGPYALYCGS